MSCLCAFVQAPAHGSCLFTLVWQVHEGHCGDVRLHGLEVVALGEFAGNMWAESTDSRMSVMFSIDAKGTAARREALEEIFRGNVGGWPGTFGSLIGDVREVRYAPIAFDAVEDLGTGVQQWPAR
ncbi:DUF1326 domain-containing protein [Streptomyces vietnamensis]|uniref:DUF1326 domain-containing protein n=1 Tax=Streptomyces vietnamensis TaxID=362257 RepID=UPI00342F2C56